MAKKVVIPVSKTNYNRAKFQTHSLEKVLRLAGYNVFLHESVLCVANPVSGDPVPLTKIELYPKKDAAVPKPAEVKPEVKTTD